MFPEKPTRQTWFPYDNKSTIGGVITAFEWEDVPEQHQATSIESNTCKKIDGKWKRLVVDYYRDGRERFPTRTVMTSSMFQDFQQYEIKVGDGFQLRVSGYHKKSGSPVIRAYKRTKKWLDR